MKSTSFNSRISLFGLFLIILCQGCLKKTEISQPDQGFSKYISSFTAGEISVSNPVVIRLKNPLTLSEQGKGMMSGLIVMKPSVKGDILFNADGEITFKPESPLLPGTRYNVTFFLGKLMEVEKPFRELHFGFKTITQNFSLEEEGLHVDPVLGSGIMSWKGTLRTADMATSADVEKMVRVTYRNSEKSILWTHSSDQRMHSFVADSLIRDENNPGELLIEWNGSSIGVNSKDKLNVQVPARSEFKTLTVKSYTSPEQKIVVQFSDPLSLDQPFEGMIELKDAQKINWQIDGNQMTLWPAEKIEGETSLTLFKGLRNTEGKSLQANQTFPLFFKNLKPEVRLLGKGVIVPDQGTLSLPFEAVSLRSVDLRIIKIYASNIRQFLQENQVDGDNEITRVGRLVYKGKVDLHPEKEENLYKWSTYKIDLKHYVEPEQGAIYRVELRFRKTYSLYDCGEKDSEKELSESEETTQEDENWDNPGWYSLFYWPDDYDWKEKDNPCHNSYYTSQRFVSRNIYASNLGMLAKEGKGFHFTFAVTNLNTALPEEGVEISLYDFQHQLLSKCSTDKNGFSTITLPRKPFVAVAAKGNQTGYLRLDDGSSLSVSNFDVSGEPVQEGVKGFLYGERGVWRPGDQIFLTFILDDPQERLPGNIPVILRLINSRGQEVEKRVATASENGFYHFPIETRADDPTGNWYARVQVGGATFEKRLKIETVKPNRLKIDLRLPDPVKAGITQQATLKSTWLHGADASSLKTIVEAEMFPVKTQFRGYEKFSFDNPGAAYNPSKQTVFEGRLDQSGQVTFPLHFPVSENIPGKLKAWFTTRVFEEGGDFSINVQQAEFSPYKRYIGIKMPDEEDGWFSTGKNYQPELVALTPEGASMPMGRVEVSLFKIDWRWWWESGEDYLARYVSGNNYQPIKTWSLNSASSSEKLNLTIDYHDWRDNGRYLLFARDTENGHAAGVTFYVSEWGDWRTDAMPDGATILAIQTDKEKYETGEKIKVRIPSSEGSRALVSLEDGSRVKDNFWVKGNGKETVFEIEVKPGMAPTLYIYVTLLQPYGSTQNDAPIRLYGVCHVAIEDPATVLHPEIKMQEELEPEKEFSVRIDEKDGKPMTYTLAIVDEGLLDLTGFKTPDPHSSFFAREALGVKTYDLFDYVAGAYGARLEKAFAVGGDEEKQMAGKKQSNRFQPVVLFTGPFTLGKGASKTHLFKMPAYVGSVKAMVIAGSGGSYGKADKTAKVRKAVMLLATLPRVIGPGEELSLPVEVFAMKETTRDVTVSLSVNDMMVPAGPVEQTISFGQPGSKIIRFNLKAVRRTGIAKIKVTAVSGKETASYETELEVRNPNPMETVEKNSLLEGGQKWSADIDVPGMPGSNSAYLEFTSVPGLNLTKHLDYLISYPHGCAEQTVSTGFSQLYLENLVELSPMEKQRTEENIKAVIQRLRGMQTGNGGFAYWPGQNASDDWCSSYAGHFLLLAAQKGFVIPADMKSRWLNYQVSRARIWRPAATAEPFIQKQEALVQAYRLYSLALAGSPEQGVMNRFREEVPGLPEARWRLAAAYFLSGQNAAANQLIIQIPAQINGYSAQGLTFGSPLRDKAMILETLLLKNDRKQAFVLLSEIAGEIGQTEWLSTQTAAWCLYSISRYFGTSMGQPGMQAKVTFEGHTEKVQSGLAVMKVPLTLTGSGKIRVAMENAGTGVLYARLVARGIPVEDTLGARQNNLRVETVFTDRTGQKLNPESLPQGTDLFLNLTVSHPGIRGKYQDLAMSTVFPSGWEILNSRIQDVPENQQVGFEYQDIRDDRIYTYFNLQTDETRRFKLALHAAYEGKFFMPAMVVEGMYDNSIYARIPGMWVRVVKE